MTKDPITRCINVSPALSIVKELVYSGKVEEGEYNHNLGHPSQVWGTTMTALVDDMQCDPLCLDGRVIKVFQSEEFCS